MRTLQAQVRSVSGHVACLICNFESDRQPHTKCMKKKSKQNHFPLVGSLVEINHRVPVREETQEPSPYFCRKRSTLELPDIQGIREL